MKVQPVANNAIEIEPDDGTTFRLHDTIHGNKSYLFINHIATKDIIVDAMQSKDLEWGHIVTQHMIRLSL